MHGYQKRKQKKTRIDAFENASNLTSPKSPAHAPKPIHHSIPFEHTKGKKRGLKEGEKRQGQNDRKTKEDSSPP
jgi:hypothetical protein